MDALRVIGRDVLLGDVSRELDRPGAVVTLVGEPGVGKTTVWGSALAAHPASWSWTARCLEVEARLGLAVLADMFVTLPEPVLADLPAVQRRAVEVVLCRVENQGGGELDGRLLGMTTLTALRQLARTGSALIGIDDLQWCDLTSLEALAFALHRLSDADVAVLATRRPDTDARLPRGVEMGVDPLDPEATADLVLAAAPSTAQARVREVVTASGGNPLFAKELARHETSGSAGQLLPSSLRETLGRRLAPLPVRTRSALVDVAVRGAPVVAELRVEQLDVELDEAFRADLIALDAGRVRFTHPLIAAAVLDAATPGELSTAHQRAAAASTDPVARVLHRLECVEPGEELARELDVAVDVALQRGDQIGARDLAARAVEMTSPEERSRRLHRLMRLEGGLHHLTQAAQLASVLLEDPGSPDAYADALMYQMGHIPDVDGVLAALREALAVPGISLVVRGEILDEMSDSLFRAGRLVEAVTLLESQLEASREPAVEYPGLVALLAFLKRLAGLPEEPLLALAVTTSRRAISARRGGSAPRMAQISLGGAGALATLEDRYVEAATMLREASEAAARAGDIDIWAYYRGLIAMRTGHLADAERLIEDTTRRVQDDNPLGIARLAVIRAWRGSLKAPPEGVDASRVRDEEAVLVSIEVDFGEGFAALLRRDFTAAWRSLRAASELMERAHYREPSQPPVLPAAVEAAVAVGEIAQATLWCERLERNAELLDSRFGRAAARRSRGFIAEALGQLCDAEACYRAGADGFAAIGVPLEQARALAALGALLRRTGRRRQARESLEQAREVFARCGAVGLAADAEAELARIGGRTAGGSNGLTASERQVAECVARGMSNADAAQALHLSVKTVETHLSHTYRKLGVANRVGLAHALEPAPGHPDGVG